MAILSCRHRSPQVLVDASGRERRPAPPTLPPVVVSTATRDQLDTFFSQVPGLNKKMIFVRWYLGVSRGRAICETSTNVTSLRIELAYYRRKSILGIRK